MTTKSYLVKSVDEAIVRARAELGEDAMLLNTRRLANEPGSPGGYEVVFAAPRAHPEPVTGTCPCAGPGSLLPMPCSGAHSRASASCPASVDQKIWPPTSSASIRKWTKFEVCWSALRQAPSTSGRKSARAGRDV